MYVLQCVELYAYVNCKGSIKMVHLRSCARTFCFSIHDIWAQKIQMKGNDYLFGWMGGNTICGIEKNQEVGESDSFVIFTAGFTITKVLDVLDTLDRHNFDKVENNNSLDSLYHKIFATTHNKDGNEVSCKLFTKF